MIAEGRSIHEYLWGNRVSVYTGLPTILGWRHHQIQQRSVLPAETIDRRARDVDALFSDEYLQIALRIIKRYGVDFIYAGPLERTRYAEAGLAKFYLLQQRGILEVIYRNPGVTIYLASPSGELAGARTRILNPER